MVQDVSGGGSRRMERELPPDTKLIFLVGAPRSGTTWLQLLLSASPRVATVTETHLFSDYTRSLFSGWKCHHDDESGVGLHHLMIYDEYLTVVRDLVSKIMARILATRPGATIVLEKTPIHALFWPDILQVFPQAHFIHIIRDPRGVVASMLAASQNWGGNWAPRRVPDACAKWAGHVNAGRKIAAATDHYLEVRYEDLHTRGIPTLKSAFAWCGIEVSCDKIAHILEQHRIERLRPTDAPERGFFRKGEVEGWQFDLTRRQIRLVEYLTGELMAKLGYSEAEPNVPSWETANILPALAVEWLRAGLVWRIEKYARAIRRG
ncbi:MAG TPA: sulfotransferase [Bradyrhizobium sp.]|nr:sulfotransferase [Bradyrhizobium sp.]